MKTHKRQLKKIHPRDAFDDIHKNLALSEFKPEAHEIAEEANVKITDIEISYHSAVDEYCIYIKGNWSGYLDGWREQGHVRP
ncbi:hypothetical protein OTK49_02595 [Vibrio coralliirubri]|uniref:hypothetical protein n=1 Tax=Vibrio coralliirubri TaxID=1516159 RepID=UPI0022838CED|nr:hypothetical protein [Vibrio coralliirubri]MCY9861406.1 hypothetical protein [Vibrio coralliirubri]